MKRNLRLLQLIVILSATFLVIPVLGAAAVVTDNVSLNEITPAMTSPISVLKSRGMNLTDCPNPSMIGDKLTCRSKEGNFTVYDRTGKKIFSMDKKKSPKNPAKFSKTLVNDEQYGTNLEERAKNGQFDQVKITEADYGACDWNVQWCDPSVPQGWELIEPDASMYWVPDWWSDDSLPDTSDLHSTFTVYNGGGHGGIMTTLDATGGQYVKVNLDYSYNDPVAIYLDNIKLGTVEGMNSQAQFDISNRSWSKSGVLKAISDCDTDLGSTTVIRSISLMAKNTPSPPVAVFNGTPRSGEVPLNVFFTDDSTGVPTSWNWSFGDGGRSTGRIRRIPT